MGLLEKFQSNGSTLSDNDGQTPPSYNKSGVLNPSSLVGSQLDLDGKTPTLYNRIGVLETNSLVGSVLDLDAITPPKYLDNKPS